MEYSNVCSYFVDEFHIFFSPGFACVEAGSVFKLQSFIGCEYRSAPTVWLVWYVGDYGARAGDVFFRFMGEGESMEGFILKQCARGGGGGAK